MQQTHSRRVTAPGHAVGQGTELVQDPVPRHPLARTPPVRRAPEPEQAHVQPGEDTVGTLSVVLDGVAHRLAAVRRHLDPHSVEKLLDELKRNPAKIPSVGSGGTARRAGAPIRSPQA